MQIAQLKINEEKLKSHFAKHDIQKANKQHHGAWGKCKLKPQLGTTT